MNGKENNNEMLSFEELRKKLGMDEKPAAPLKEETADINSPAPEVTETEKSKNDDFAQQIEKALEEQVSLEDSATDAKIVIENGKTFLDITEQYVSKEPEAVEENTDKQDKTENKKQVRTFNEIFAGFFSKIIPSKKDGTKEFIRKTVMDISIIAIICCVIAFGNLYRQRRAELKIEEGLKNKFVDTGNLDDNQYIEAWEDVFATYPNTSFPEGMNLKYAYLYALNQDFVGWLRIENTNMDVQVVQSKDNDYYHRRDFYGKSSRYGCPYMDYRNDSKYLNDNTVIYGHHMTDGLMFSNLDKYKTLEGYKESPVIKFDTLYETYCFKVFAAFITNAEAQDDNGYIFNYTVTDFLTDERFNNFIAEVEKRSIIDTEVTVQPDDKILTLVTCSYEFNEARLVVMGRMVRENEDIDVDTSSASLNTSPKYPQAWYDAKGMANPYKDAPQVRLADYIP
ncbi:MAG: class B sortase, partial [Candidatus Fimenecus sp.]